MQDIFFNKLIKFFTLFIFIISIFSISSEEISLSISLKNGTTGKKGEAEKIKLIALQGGMIPIAEFSNKSGDFTLDKINVEPSSPILIQVQYKNANYNKMIPPVPEFRKKVHEILVYENIDSLKDFDIKSLLQIIRGQNEITIFKIYLIQNLTNPPKSFYSELNALKIYVPEKAMSLSGQLTQGQSKMAIPLNFIDGKNNTEKIFNRALLPGVSELQISYTLPAENIADINFKDKFFFEDDSSSRIIFYKPKKMNVQINNPKESIPLEKDIPIGVGAYKVKYNPEGIEIFISGGKPEVQITEESQKRKIVNGKIFISWEKTLLGVLGIIGILFSLSFIFVFKKK